MGVSRGAVGGLVGAVGLVAGLVGYMTDLYSSSIATVLMLGIWIVGGAIVALVFSKKD
jgi:FtsH-binding integral membrane protein